MGFPSLNRNAGSPDDVRTGSVPPNHVLVSAMDRVLVDIARGLNNSHLVVSDPALTGVLHTGKLSTGMYPVYFAPGVNANPLVWSSNPLNIAVDIMNGVADSATGNRVKLFLDALRAVGRINPAQQVSLQKRYMPTREPVFVYSTTARTRVWYRGVDDMNQFCDEFISYPDEPVRAYGLLIQDDITLSNGRVIRTRNYGP